MNLYLLRHAIAADKNEWKGVDSDRPLTEEGSRKIKKAAKGLRRMHLEIDWILTSPYRRAYDTAMVVANELRLKKQVRVLKSLLPNGNVKALVRHLGLNFRSWESVILVGHEPYLGHLLGTLTTGADAGFQLDKGGLAKLTADSMTYGKCATLEWLLTQKLLKNIN